MVLNVVLGNFPSPFMYLHVWSLLITEEKVNRFNITGTHLSLQTSSNEPVPQFLVCCPFSICDFPQTFHITKTYF